LIIIVSSAASNLLLKEEDGVSIEVIAISFANAMPENNLTIDLKISFSLSRTSFKDSTSVLPAVISNSCLTTSVYVLLISSSRSDTMVVLTGPVSAPVSAPVLPVSAPVSEPVTPVEESSLNACEISMTPPVGPSSVISSLGSSKPVAPEAPVLPVPPVFPVLLVPPVPPVLTPKLFIHAIVDNTNNTTNNIFVNFIFVLYVCLLYVYVFIYNKKHSSLLIK
jgi:hypothetical protein